MSYVTAAENLGPHKVPGADHNEKYDKFAMQPGTAYRLTDGGERNVVQIDKKVAEAAKFDWCLSWIEGRVVAEFVLGDVRFAQPTKEDTRRPERTRGLRVPRREAPGVAPPVAETPEDTPAPKVSRARKPLSIVL